MKDRGTIVYAKEKEKIQSISVREFTAEIAEVHRLDGLFDPSDFGTEKKVKIEVGIGVSGRIVYGKLI